MDVKSKNNKMFLPDDIWKYLLKFCLCDIIILKFDKNNGYYAHFPIKITGEPAQLALKFACRDVIEIETPEYFTPPLNPKVKYRLIGIIVDKLFYDEYIQTFEKSPYHESHFSIIHTVTYSKYVHIKLREKPDKGPPFVAWTYKNYDSIVGYKFLESIQFVFLEKVQFVFLEKNGLNQDDISR
jgi:hypothetical protein